MPQQKAISMRTPYSRPRMLARLRPLRLMSASSRRTALRLFISSGCSMEPRARALRWISGELSRFLGPQIASSVTIITEILRSLHYVTIMNSMTGGAHVGHLFELDEPGRYRGTRRGNAPAVPQLE